MGSTAAPTALSYAQYAALVRLVEACFVAGYGYFTPLRLRRGETEELRSRFAPPRWQEHRNVEDCRNHVHVARRLCRRPQ